MSEYVFAGSTYLTEEDWATAIAVDYLRAGGRMSLTGILIALEQWSAQELAEDAVFVYGLSDAHRNALEKAFERVRSDPLRYFTQEDVDDQALQAQPGIRLR